MFCTDTSSPFLFMFSDVAPNLLYYSHFISSFSCLIVSAYVYFNNRILATRLLFIVSIVFSLWALFDIFSWVHVDSRIIMFFWATMNILEPMIFLFMFYFTYVFLEKRDLPFRYKIIGAFFLLPLLLMLPTKYNLDYFDIVSCEAIQGSMMSFVYFVNFLFFLITVVFVIYKYFSEKRVENKKQIFWSGFGVVLFLGSFYWANLLGNLTTNWVVTQYGMFGMPIFMVFLGYIIIKYSLFDIKLVNAQALVFVLAILVGSETFFVKTFASQILVFITFVLLLVTGYFLIKSVKEEIRQKNELRDMTEQLGAAYDRLHKLDRAKSEFLSIASHQLRTPLTSIKGFTSLVLEGTYGKVPKEINNVLEKVYISNERLIKLVEDLLNISRIESGRISFDFRKGDVVKLVKEVTDSFVLAVKNKKLKLEYQAPSEKIEDIFFSESKLREVISNLIDNSIKYTKKGSIIVSVVKKSAYVLITVADTGMGIDPHETDYIFEKFQRGQDVNRVQTEGVGLGLYVCKKIVDAHKGRIWAESTGVGRGSRFIVALDLNFKPENQESGNF